GPSVFPTTQNGEGANTWYCRCAGAGLLPSMRSCSVQLDAERDTWLLMEDIVNVMEAKGTVRQWVAANAETWPGFRAAHLVGGITAMPDDALFPITKDIDLHLIFDNESPMVQQHGPISNILEAQVDGLAIEAGLKPVSEYVSPEAVLGNPELAFHFTVESSIYDPDGWLSDLS